MPIAYLQKELVDILISNLRERIIKENISKSLYICDWKTGTEAKNKR